MKIQLTLTVDYQPNGATSELLALTLEQAAEHLADSGLLSGNTGADVVSACHHVVEIDERVTTPAAHLEHAVRIIGELTQALGTPTLKNRGRRADLFDARIQIEHAIAKIKN